MIRTIIGGAVALLSALALAGCSDDQSTTRSLGTSAPPTTVTTTIAPAINPATAVEPCLSEVQTEAVLRGSGHVAVRWVSDPYVVEQGEIYQVTGLAESSSTDGTEHLQYNCVLQFEADDWVVTSVEVR